MRKMWKAGKLIPMLLILPALLGLTGLQAAQPASDVLAFILAVCLVQPVLRRLKADGKKEKAEVSP